MIAWMKRLGRTRSIMLLLSALAFGSVSAAPISSVQAAPQTMPSRAEDRCSHEHSWHVYGWGWRRYVTYHDQAGHWHLYQWSDGSYYWEPC